MAMEGLSKGSQLQLTPGDGGISSLAREEIENQLLKIKVDSLSHCTDVVYGPDDMSELMPKMTTRLRELTKAPQGDDLIHFSMLLLRAGIIGTSLKTVYGDNYYSYTMDKVYSVRDADIFPYIRHVTSGYKRKKANGLKAFFASLEKPYLLVARYFPQVFRTRSNTRKGIPSGFEYLGADFLTGSSDILSDKERAIINRGSEHAINRASRQGETNVIVSLYDI
nr:minor coat protein [Thesium chinense closterovirus 1]